MLDLINLNIGSAGFGNKRGSISATDGKTGTRVVSLPKPVDTDETKTAKRIARLFDVGDMYYYGVAAALWDVAGDAVKRHIYSLADALLEVAADKHEKGFDYTLVEREIGINASQLRRHLTRTGFLTPDGDGSTLDL